MTRRYTGYDVTAKGKRAGLEALVDQLEITFGVWNNGTYGVRPKRGKSSLSVHATGRAADLSWRGSPYRGTGSYDDACRMMDFLEQHAEELFIEAIFDYYPKPWGRGWLCDRSAWRIYDEKAFSGAPGGDWVHIEIGNEKADDADYYNKWFAENIGEPQKITPRPAKKTEKAPEGKKPWLQVGSKGEAVKKVQEIVGAKVDGDFGPKTEEAVKKWQSEHDQHVDGIWGPGSDKHSKNCNCSGQEDTKTKAKKGMAYPGRALARGSRGQDVEKVQAVVGAKPDGHFGPATHKAVIKWQRANGLTADGIVGPKTWAKMF